MMSRIRFMVFRPTATRGRLSIILTLTPHSLLHVAPDYGSYHPLHLLHTQLNALITHTQLNPIGHAL